MKIVLNAFGIITFLVFLGACSQKGQTKYPDEIEEKIKQVENNLAGWVQTGDNDSWTLADAMKRYKINGVSIAVIDDYKIDWAIGYGFADVSEKRPVTEKTLFQAASISKSLNSVGIMKLVQDGKLDLASDINKYLTSWKFPYDSLSGNRKITLTNLLSHTAGLTVHGFPGYPIEADLPGLQQILDGQNPSNTLPVRSSEEPGKNVIYSGGGTTISQLIIQDVTNQPYDEFMRKNVLDPLGMSGSSFTQPPPGSKKKIFATGYKADGREVEGKYHVYPEQAAAGLWTNPIDLCRYIIETQLSYKGESSKVLNQEMTSLRLTPILEDAGLGTFINSRVTGSVKYFNHNGGNEGFSCTSVGSLGEGKGVVVMTNSDNGVILEEILNSVAIVYKWKDYYLPEKMTVVNVESQVLDKYTGKYNVGNGTATIRKNVEGLSLNVFEDLWFRMYFTSDSVFFIRQMRGPMKFRTGKDGEVEGIIFNGEVAKKIE